MPSKWHNFFFIWPLSLSVSHPFYPLFTPFFQKSWYFSLKLRILVGKRQAKNFPNKKKFECFRCFCVHGLYQKLEIWKSYDCSNTRPWWKKWRRCPIVPLTLLRKVKTSHFSSNPYLFSFFSQFNIKKIASFFFKTFSKKVQNIYVFFFSPNLNILEKVRWLQKT